MTPLFILWLVLGILAFNIVLWFGILTFLKRLANRRLEELKARFPERDVIKLARASNLIGLQSPSRKMLRGNGTLLLTKDDLVFQLWLPKTEILIPRKAIREVGEVKSFGGKTVFQPLMQLRYSNALGEEESLAIYLSELETWIKLLKRS